jgi:hypothetical protein
MAKREGGSNPMGWLLIGALAGAAATVALYLFFTRPGSEPAPLNEAAPSLKMEPPALPVEPVQPAVPAAPPTLAPVAPTTAVPPPAARGPSQRSPQIDDDAAATGMTGPVNPAPAAPLPGDDSTPAGGAAN